MKKSQFNNAIILLDKPVGKTSFETINCLKKLTGIKKVGHSGTLDKFASGLLVVCTGQATKLTHYFLNSDKRYEGVVEPGIETDSCDINGKVTKESSVEDVTKEKVKILLNRFKGEIMQNPPLFSALKVKGKRASDLVRAGKDVELKARKINVYELNLNWFDDETKNFEIEVFSSKGTYIRSIARDIGDALGCGAYLKELRRTESGNFTVENAIKIDEISDFLNGKEIDKSFFVKPIEALKEYSSIVVDESIKSRVFNGAFFDRDEVLEIVDRNCNRYMILDEEKNLIAIAEINIETWHINYLNVFNSL